MENTSTCVSICYLHTCITGCSNSPCVTFTLRCVAKKDFIRASIRTCALYVQSKKTIRSQFEIVVNVRLFPFIKLSEASLIKTLNWQNNNVYKQPRFHRQCHKTPFSVHTLARFSVFVILTNTWMSRSRLCQ